MKRRSFRDRLWDRCTRRIPEGHIVPPWAIALRLVLYPISTGAVLMQRHHPYDLLTDTWNLHGARFSNRALQAMAGRVGEGHWYRFRRDRPGDVVCIEEVRRPTPGRHRFPTPHQIAECGGPCLEGGPSACDCGLRDR